MPKAKSETEEEVEEEETEETSSKVRLKYGGIEHVREVQRSDLGVHPDSDEVLTWDASNNFISPVELEEEEVQALARSGGAWAVVTEESSTAPEEDEHIDLPTVSAPPASAPVETQAPPQVTEETVETQASATANDESASN